jgi:hypothetical protein
MTTREEWLSWLYPVPDPLTSEYDGRKHRHEDLGRMSVAQIRREVERLRDRLRHEDVPSEWLLERLNRLEGLL